MSSQPASRRNSNTNFRRNALFWAALTAISTALMVVAAFLNPVTNAPPQQKVVVVPAPTPAPAQTPEAVRAPIPTPGPTLCGRWRSVKSQKDYNFVCRGQNSFQIQELNDGLQNNSGSGWISSNGEIQAELLIAKKDRTAHLRLQLSSDGQRLDGTWYGNHARESGTLSFYRVQ